MLMMMLFGGEYSVGYADVIRQSLEPIKESIDFAFIYGSIAKATDTARSDTDLMIIGNDLYPPKPNCNAP
jgi:predicted nucleotidyltransferase